MSALNARAPSGGLAELRTTIAVRAYVPRVRPHHTPEPLPQPDVVLVLDTETTTDYAQAFLFGSYRIYTAAGALRQEGLIHADDLSPADMETLRRYVADRAADNGGHLRLRSRREVLRQVFWPIAFKARARVVGYNLPFDLSRLAFAWRRARNGGFTLQLFESVDADGREWPDRYRPEIRVKSLGSKRNFISFVTPARLDAHLREGGRAYRGRFLDLHTLVYALTDASLSLDAAAEEFDLADRKHSPSGHGVITPEYIDYNRQDVRLTWALHQGLMAEWRRHPIDLAPEQAYSPAAISKAYLRAAGVTSPSERAGRVAVDRLGQATTAYSGGRTACRIRREPLPVRYVDFTSMYPTVFALQNLWSWVIAERLTAAEATAEARSLLGTLNRQRLHDPTVWPMLAGVFCRVRPAGDLLPVRARYGAEEAGFGGEPPSVGSDAWTIGLNPLTSSTDLWYTLADVVVAALLGTTTPTILEAFRIAPEGRSCDLRLVRLRGAIDVDPATDDLFRFATEERARLKDDRSLSKAECRRIRQFLKTLANGGAYGIFAEFRQLDPVPGGTAVSAHGLWPIDARVTTPEEPGEFAFPPLAATITGAARLLLALLQADVEARGGTYAACDTDSLLIVSSEAGGLLPCEGGYERLPDGRAAVRALPWAEVDVVLAGLDPLLPYRSGAIRSLVKLEDENFAADGRGHPDELYAAVLSSKRYALYNRTGDRIVLRKASNHGLGLYRSPIKRRDDWTAEWPEWADIVWRRIVDELEGRDPGPEPGWFALPAVSQIPVSSPAVLGPFSRFNEGKRYRDQVKPFGFLLAGHVDPLAPLPAGMPPGTVTPVAPYTDKPDALLTLPWRNRRDGSEIRVTTRPGGEPGAVRLQTYGDVFRDYRLHPETKSGDPRGGLGRRGTRGLLPRLHVVAVGLPLHIGKESNRLEEVEDGIITDPAEVYVEYRDERREWEATLPALRRLRDERGWRHLADAAGLSERALRYALNGGKVPHREARAALIRLAAVERM
jgi:hypothetical protein